MHRLLLLLFLALPLWAQETNEAEPEATEDSAADSAESVDAKEAEASDADDVLDELYSEEDDDAFIPSEDVKFGQSIPFPTDI